MQRSIFNEYSHQISIKLSVGCNIHKFKTNKKTVLIYENSILRLRCDCSAFTGIMEVLAELKKIVNIKGNSLPVLIAPQVLARSRRKCIISKIKTLKAEKTHANNKYSKTQIIEKYFRDLNGKSNSKNIS